MPKIPDPPKVNVKPAVPSVPLIPDPPKVQSATKVPDVPTKPDVPKVPSVPDVPTIEDLKIPRKPDIRVSPDVPGSPLFEIKRAAPKPGSVPIKIEGNLTLISSCFSYSMIFHNLGEWVFSEEGFSIYQNI